MTIHAICIGTELLLGHTVNTNLAFLGNELQAAGYAVEREICIPDTPATVAAELSRELADAEVIVTVGGLGPTSDDITRQTVADELGLPLVFQPDVYHRIAEYLARRNVNVPDEALRAQAMVPEGARILPNKNGTAPGLCCIQGEKLVFMLPGPPRELQPMVRESVMPLLREKYAPTLAIAAVSSCGIPESSVAARVEQILKSYPEVHPAYCARPFMVDVRLATEPANRSRLDAAEQAVRRALGNAVIGSGGTSLPAALGELLRARNATLATAESCTAGQISSAITSVPGSSSYFAGGIVSYSNTAKQQLLGVNEQTLETHGAVSEHVALEMMQGAMERLAASTGIAVTGIAGPGGGTEEKPVGLVYIATGTDAVYAVRRYVFPGNREAVRQRTVTVALNQLRLQLLEHRPIPAHEADIES